MEFKGGLPDSIEIMTGYSCEDFPSRIILHNLLLRKDKIRHNTYSEIQQDLSL